MWADLGNSSPTPGTYVAGKSPVLRGLNNNGLLGLYGGGPLLVKIGLMNIMERVSTFKSATTATAQCNKVHLLDH